MTFKTTKLRDAITFALAAGATTLAGTGVAFAQEATEGQEATTLDRIEVTGSRIRRTDVETSQPVFSLSREDIAAQGLTSVGDVIQNITANGSTLNSTFNNGGNGETRVSLRNLGSNRTLVLVNGRRWVGGTGLGGAVDLNTIPTAAVERIEVLKDGASTIYGSDAIAGVVNIILRQNFDGAEANAFIGGYDKGDGFRQSYDFTVGSNGDRWSAMLGVGYVKEEPVMAGDREISAEPIFGTGNSFGSSTSPNGNFSSSFGGACPDGPDSNTDPDPRCDPNQVPGSFTYDDGNSGNDWRRRVVPADIYNFAPENYLLTPQERRSIFASGSLDITDDVRFKVTTQYNERKSEQLLAAMPVVLGIPATGTKAGDVVISDESIYNTFGPLNNNGIEGDGTTIDWVQRRVTETGGRSFNQKVTTYAFNGGLEGSFDIGERFFDWEAGMFYGENQANNTTFGLFNVLALRDALGPSMIDPATGAPICVTTPGDADTAIGGCVPLNLLGAAGSVTQDMLGFSTFVAHDEYNYTQKTYYANIGGDLFDLPGGPLAFSVGVEKRFEDGYDSPDALINSGNTTGNARTATAGGYDVQEAYIELAIPVLADVPFAQLLDFSLASRYSDYSNFGDTTNSKFGFRWKPIEDLMVRGNWTEGFRAPAIGELFAGQADSFPNLQDPCNVNNFVDQGPVQQQRCIAEGVPNGGYTQTNPQIRITVGGNPDLLPEKAESKTLGLVYSPSWIEGFDVSLDWWEIEIEDSITTLGGAAIIQRCLDSGGTGPTCALYSRQPGGAIIDLLNVNTNIGGTRVEGYDLTLGYRMPETAYGRFSFVLDTTYLAEQEFDVDGDGIFGEDNQLEPAIGQPFFFNEGGNTAGEFQGAAGNAWRIRANLATRWEMGDWGATWNARYYSGQDEPCQFLEDYGFADLCTDTDRFTSIPTDSPGPDPDDPTDTTPPPNGVWDGNGVNGDFLDVVPSAEHRIGGTTYHDVSVYWSAPWNAKVTLGVNNVLDKDPPLAFNAFANSFDPQYEVPGRFYYMRYTQKF